MAGGGACFLPGFHFSLFQKKYVNRLNCSDPRRPKARDVLPSVRTAVRRVSYLVLKIPNFLSCFGWGPLEPPPLQRTKSGRGSATEPMAARPRRILRPSIGGGVAEGRRPSQRAGVVTLGPITRRATAKPLRPIQPNVCLDKMLDEKVVIPSQGTHPPHFQNF